jgi:hypothetical protein
MQLRFHRIANLLTHPTLVRGLQCRQWQSAPPGSEQRPSIPPSGCMALLDLRNWLEAVIPRVYINKVSR